jgi:hypothetical protein
VHKDLYLKLVRKTRLNVNPSSIVDLLEEIEALIPAYLESPGDLEHYLRVVITHRLIKPRERERFTDLLRLTTKAVWSWNDQIHRPLFK